jgi:hypothetical protein
MQYQWLFICTIPASVVLWDPEHVSQSIGMLSKEEPMDLEYCVLYLEELFILEPEISASGETSEST